jgi:putative hydrolase of the HAD superfamily
VVIVFDMDDTLYEEESFARSGFAAVASLLKERYGVPQQPLFAEMVEIQTQHGRGQVFDLLLERHGWLNRRLVRDCLSCYRTHRPTIVLNKPAQRCLDRLSKHPLYVVTDGNKVAQAAKVNALGLDNIVKKVFITHRYGRAHSKPSPYCFLKIQEREGVSASKVVYIGDNPSKDFVGIMPLGFRTIRVLTGPYATMVAKPGFDAEVTVGSLDEISHSLLKTFESKHS